MKPFSNIRPRKRRLEKKLKVGNFKELFIGFKADIVLPRTPSDNEDLINMMIDLTDEIHDVVESTSGGYSGSGCSENSIDGWFVINVNSDKEAVIEGIKKLNTLSNVEFKEPVDANYYDFC